MMVTGPIEQISASIDYTFVCYARDDEAFVATVAEAMRARGVPIWLDQWNIQPGADWSKAVDDGLNGCTKFLIVLSPAAVASDEVAGELRAALDGRKNIVPLLYKPCEVPRQLRLKQRIDFTGSRGISQASLDRLADALLGKPPLVPFIQERKGRSTLLQDVSEEAAARLRLVGTETPISVHLEYQSHQVARTWDDEVVIHGRQRLVPIRSDIVEVVDDPAIDHKLLILGEPGAGKTTVLLQLMERLVARAELDESQPIPVLISLASWKNDKTIGDWLVEELQIKHGVRVDLGVRWRDSGKLAPLFDALDELPPQHQHACVEAINDFQQEYGPSQLVVCCRRAEYENLSVKLRLRGAVCLLPLTTEQIRHYLHCVECADLWSAIAGDQELVQMAQSPLLLSFMTAIPIDSDAQRWQDAASATERHERLFDAYVSARMSQAGSNAAYSREQTLRWLSKLAAVLKRQGQSEFLIERVQPDWLESPVQRWCYRAAVLIVTATATVVVAELLLWLTDIIPRGNVGIALQQAQWFKRAGALLNNTAEYVIAVVVGCLVAFRRTIVPVETLTWSWTRAWTNLGRWAQKATLTALDYALPLAVAGGAIWSFAVFDAPVEQWQRTGAFVGLAAGMCLAVFLALIKPSSWLPPVQNSAMRPRVVDSLTVAALYALGPVIDLFSTGSDQFIANVGVVLLVIPTVFAILAFSRASTNRVRAVFVRALLIGALSGVAVGVMFGLRVSSPAKNPLFWLRVWVSGGLAIALTAAMVIGLTLRAREWFGLPQRGLTAGEAWSRGRTAAIALAIAIALCLAAVVFAAAWGAGSLRNVALFAVGVPFGLHLSAFAVVLGTLSVTAAVVPLAAVLGALAGALSGATGADVERRLVPNQGIRHSARNVLLFAALGTLIIGVPYGVFNLFIAALATRTLPTSADWLRLGVGSGLPFGVLAGLLPGAACIQHFALRFVLWASGNMPLKYVTFLNFATRQRFVQRVGGRYRFIHTLLRDHLGQAASTPATV
jgi:hypothetical protein